MVMRGTSGGLLKKRKQQQDQVSTAEVATAVEVWIVCSLYLILGMPISAIVYVVKNLLVSSIFTFCEITTVLFVLLNVKHKIPHFV